MRGVPCGGLLFNYPLSLRAGIHQCHDGFDDAGHICNILCLVDNEISVNLRGADKGLMGGFYLIVELPQYIIARAPALRRVTLQPPREAQLRGAAHKDAVVKDVPELRLREQKNAFNNDQRPRVARLCRGAPLMRGKVVIRKRHRFIAFESQQIVAQQIKVERFRNIEVDHRRSAAFADIVVIIILSDQTATLRSDKVSQIGCER